jgi:ribonuclease Z
MDCFVLGTGGMMPMPHRRLSSVAVRSGGKVYLLDCGEGTQVPYKELHVGMRSLRLVAITHLHADHCLGLPGMLMLRAQVPDPAPLTLLGPPGLDRLVRHLRQDLPMYINYEIRVRCWTGEQDELAHEDDQLRILWRPLKHTVTCLGYRLEQHQRPGRFDPRKARRLGVPEGPLWGQLQQGQTVQTPQGERVRPEQVLGPPRRGRHLAYVTDTAPTANLELLLAGTDMAFVESMFLPEHAKEAAAKRHMTVTQSCQAARRAGAARVALIHISPRYGPEDLPRLEAEARAHHPQVHVPRDGELLEVPAPPD